MDGWYEFYAIMIVRHNDAMAMREWLDIWEIGLTHNNTLVWC